MAPEQKSYWLIECPVFSILLLSILYLLYSLLLFGADKPTQAQEPISAFP